MIASSGEIWISQRKVNDLWKSLIDNAKKIFFKKKQHHQETISAHHMLFAGHKPQLDSDCSTEQGLCSNVIWKKKTLFGSFTELFEKTEAFQKGWKDSASF